MAKASLEELLIDYQDYLRVHNLPQWDLQHHRYNAMRQYASSDKINDEYAVVITRMNEEEIANLCITLINQATYMLKKLIARQQEQFITEGGIREQMTKARLEYRNKNK